MEREPSGYIEEPMPEMEPELTPDMIEEMEDMQSFEGDESAEETFMQQQELMEAYGSPEPDERQNAHTFIHKAAFNSNDTVRTTFLNEWELGRPIFSIRFLMDMEDISIYYLAPLLKKLKLDPEKHNSIAAYFREKIKNITDSGMSNKGFAMNLNVTRKMDSTRERLKNQNQIENLKGGVK